MSRNYLKRNPSDIVNGASLICRVNNRVWEMRCKCGKSFVSQPSETSGRCKSCGYKYLSELRTIHGESPKSGKKNASRLYEIWDGMRNRCNNQNNHNYNDYGGRGISVCDEWSDYLVFKKWAIENGYSDGLTIDRINVNGNYAPINCRWATRKEQSKNKRKSTRN